MSLSTIVFLFLLWGFAGYIGVWLGFYSVEKHRKKNKS
jgi:hypothetical protein